MAIASDERPPIRIVTRALAELQTAIMAHALPLFEGSIDRFAIFTLLVAQRFRAKEEGDYPVSILGIASSLSRPFETVRRNVRRLAAEEMCQITPAGIVLAGDFMARPGIDGLFRHAHDCLVRFVEHLIDLEAILPYAPTPVRYEPAVGVRAASDLMLAVAEGNNDSHGTFADLVIFSTVLAYNYRAITLTPALARSIRNETHPTPASLLRGARPGIVARVLSLPERTVRRRMKAMLGVQLTLEGHDYFVSKTWLNDERSVAISRHSVAETRRVLGKLAAAGFPFDAPRKAYLTAEPPPYLPLA